jgi:hypothetical protein
MWHCYSEADKEVLQAHEPNFFGIGGGCTIGLRSISMAVMLGYNNIHFFGFDSCLADDDQRSHAYDLSTQEEKDGLIGEGGKIYSVRMGLGGPDGKKYRCMGYQLAQMHHFNQLYSTHAHIFTPTFHGGGMLAESYEHLKEHMKREAAKRAITSVQ